VETRDEAAEFELCCLLVSVVGGEDLGCEPRRRLPLHNYITRVCSCTNVITTTIYNRNNMSKIAPLAAQTLAQDTHTVHHPDRSNIAPSTSADAKFPVRRHDDIDEDDDRHSISSSIFGYHERPARRPLPPLPDLRFEQSYMASIALARGVWWKVALITLKDQVLMPLLQGLGFNLALFGWRWWNRGVKFSGAGLGGECSLSLSLSLSFSVTGWSC